MIRRKVDSSLEKGFLTAMIVSTPFLASAFPIIDPNLFGPQFLRLVSGWCSEHFRDYREAPGKAIQTRYHAWVENDKPEESEESAVRGFLESLSAAHDTQPDLNVPHLLGEFRKFTTLRLAAKVNDQLNNAVMLGKPDEAVAAIESFRPVIGSDSLGYPIDRDMVTRAFAMPPESIIKLPPAAARFFGHTLSRDSLIMFQGAEKKGKTYLCMDVLYWAIRSKLNVAMFQVGDLSEPELSMRLLVRMAQIPEFREDCAGVRIPKTLTLVEGQDGKEAVVDYETRTYPKPLDVHTAQAARKTFLRRHGLTGREEVRFSVHANSSINVKGIDTIIRRWKHEQDFVPSVILVDYADILAPEPRNSKDESSRDQVNETWKALRRLSQEWHACVIVPTQANAASYTTKLQTMSNFSNDKRKYAHCTACVGLNQEASEKDQQVMRLNMLLRRKGYNDHRRCLFIAQCLPLGVAMVRSEF